MIERVKTGIKGLDELMGGGIPRGSTVLLSGGAGTGKTLFGIQFLYNGAIRYKEPGVYVSLEEEPGRVIKNTLDAFGWDLNSLINKKLLSVIKAELYNFDKLKALIEDEVDRIKAKRLVIDQSAILGLFFEKKFQVRKSIFELSKMLKNLGCTTVIVSEIPEGTPAISSFGVEEFVADGIIILHFLREGNVLTRALSVRKMRTTYHDTGIHPIQITKKGIEVFPTEQVFEQVK
ncbi:MAG: ATPase domain-containing protein [Candidatus Aenigmarchaeota archaeon]|nr:ATPase domain-containing protein [Candidatus Aenigmarchaeota archaeon]